MKKIFIKILSFVLTIGSFFIFAKNVNASNVTLKMDYINGIFYVRKGDGMNQSAKFVHFSLNGKVAYCIEPGVHTESNYVYSTNDLSKSPFSTEITKKIQLIGHYGYEYPGHQTEKYRMATQALIWETVRKITVNFYTKQYGQGTKYDISKERDEIMRLVNNHLVKPSFNGTQINAVVDEEIFFEDENMVLEDYEIIEDGGNNVRIEDNRLYITTNSMTTSTIMLQKKMYDSETSIIYIANDGKSQKLGRFRASDPVNAYIEVKGVGGTVSIVKEDFETKISQGDAVLSGAEYGIYDEYDALITQITTDNQAHATSELLNKLGTFYAQEIKAPSGYLLDNTKYYFDITEDDLNPTIKVSDTVIKGNLSILKLYGMDSLIPEPNITFDIYLKSSNSLYKSINTNEDGMAGITLPYGTYTVKQKNTTANYEKVQDFEITINENGQSIFKNLVNNPLSGKLKVVKVDADTQEVVRLSGIKFKIKDLSTNEYVCQKITYPNASTICEYETNDDGFFITPNNLLGDFEIEEVKNQKIDGYLWNDTKVQVHIGDNSVFENDAEYGKIVSVIFENKRVKGKLEINKYGERLRTQNDHLRAKSTNLYSEFNDNNIVEFVPIPLSNVKFGLYKEDGTLVRDAITDSNGYVCFDDLELGKYYIKELSVDSKYIIDDNKYEFDLKYIDQFTPIVMDGRTIQNYLQKGTLEFTKTDLVSGEVIPNTIIEIYSENDNLVFGGITNQDGKITIEQLPIGKYYILEIEPATSYLINNEKVFFEIKENGEVVKANMTNKKITGDFELSKTDISTDEPLANILFEIYTKDNKLVISERTDENGKIFIKNLDYGDYYFVEKESLEKYVLNDEKMYFSIKNDGETVKSNVKNKKIIGSLELTKIDVSTNETLPNTLLEIYTIDDELVFSGRTDEDGKIYISELEYGDYYILETEAPDGYTINDEKMYFSIKNDGEIVKATITDEKIIIDVPITEQDKSYIFYIVSGVIIAIGIGIIIYGKSKSKED